MNKCLFNSNPGSRFHGHPSLTRPVRYACANTTLRVIDNDFAPGLS